MDFDLFKRRTTEESKTQATFIQTAEPVKAQDSLFDWELPPEQWVPASKVRQCWKDAKEFSMFVWKQHCRKCGRVFCSKCIRSRAFDTDGSRLTDANQIKTREGELGRKLRITKICQDCDHTFSVFEDRMTQLNQKRNINYDSESDFFNSAERKQESPLIENTNPLSMSARHQTKSRRDDNSPTDESRDQNLLQPWMQSSADFNKQTRFRRSERGRRGSMQVTDFVKLLDQEESQSLQKNDDSVKNLQEYSHRHIAKVVAIQLLKSELDVAKWHSLITGFVLRAVEQIRPSSRLLGDSMNINDYVKIKLIEWPDNSQSQYVNGVVMSKNLADRRMQSAHEKPSILLVKNTLEIGQTDLQSEIDQEEHLIKILSKKLEQIDPKIVIVEQDVTYKILCMLRDERKISVITNMDESKLNRIARLTETVTANGITVIDKRFSLGKCKSFRITNQTKLAREKGFNLLGRNNPGSTSTTQSQMRGKVEDQFLMTIDGCNPALGCTIVLSGPPNQEKELKTLKQAIRKILLLARNIYLERYYLSMLQVKVSVPPALSQHLETDFFKQYVLIYKKTDEVSPFLITQKLENRPVLMYQELMITLKADKRQSNKQNTASGTLLIEEATAKVESERDVYSKIDKICGQPIRQRTVFYKQKFDEQGNPKSDNDSTLFSYLEKLVQEHSQVCSICEKPMMQHAFELYHAESCLQVLVRGPSRNDAHQSQNKLKSSESLSFHLECKLCNTKTKPLALPSQVYEYSVARFYEQLFYNCKQSTLKIAECSCNQKAPFLRDQYKFVFQVTPSHSVEFQYIPKDVYKIQLVQPKKHNTSKNLQALVKEQYDIVCTQIVKAMEVAKERFRGFRSHFTQLHQTHAQFRNLADPCLDSLYAKLKKAESILEKINENTMVMLNQGLDQMSKFETQVFSALFLKRKLLINLFSFQRLTHENVKIAALLIVLCKRRHYVLAEMQHTSSILNMLDSDNNAPDEQHVLDTIVDSIANQLNDNPLSNTTPDVSKLQLNQQQQSKTSSDQKSNQSVRPSCFIEDFADPASLHRASMKKNKVGGLRRATSNQSFVAVQPQSQVCPVSGKQSFFCNNQQVILQTYSQICEEVQDQIEAMYLLPSQQPQLQQQLIKESELSNSQELSPLLSSMPGNSANGTKSILNQTLNITLAYNQSDPLTMNDPVTNKDSILVPAPKKGAPTSKDHQWTVQRQKLLAQIEFNNPYLTMPLGVNNQFIQVQPQDVGSIIAFALNSNVYWEALTKLNYLGLEQLQTTDKKEKNEIEQMLLMGKDDVLNSEEINKKALEHEMLQQTKIEFKIKFSTASKDVQIRIRDNRKDYNLYHSSVHFKTGSLVSGQKRTDDLQSKVMPGVSHYYLKNQQCLESLSELDSLFTDLQQQYFGKEAIQKLKENIQTKEIQPSQSQSTNNLAQYWNNANITMNPESSKTGRLEQSSPDISKHPQLDDHFHISDEVATSPPRAINLEHRSSLIFKGFQEEDVSPKDTGKKSTKSAFQSLGIGRSATVKRKETQPAGQEQDNQANHSLNALENQAVFDIESPQKTIEQIKGSSLTTGDTNVDFELKIMYPKRFQALRRFYCGTHTDFISSILQVKHWAATGGRTNSSFHKSHDNKYVFKEVKKSEFKMFLDFGPTYFDYMVKAFFHNYPCALAKILGAYTLTIKTGAGGPQQRVKRYILVLENLNLGIETGDEQHVVRYDLKGSEINRLVATEPDQPVTSQFPPETHLDELTTPQATAEKKVLMDSNFLLLNNGRPILLNRKLANLLHICINNDTLCLQKYNIVDYSLLMIINKKSKRIRFGIIDYLQMYTLEKYFETQLKKAINLGANPTIIEPKAYRMRFTFFTKLYLIGVYEQQERSKACETLEELKQRGGKKQ